MSARIRRGVAVVVTGLVLSACAGIPDSGPVTRVEDDPGLGESTVRYTPARPAAGATPQEIVRGYLDAMLAFPVSTATASAFLSPEAAKDWRPLAGVRVYADPRVLSPGSPGGQDGDRTEVELDVERQADLDVQGRYRRADGRDVRTYRLERVGGEWRITNPQAGTLVTAKYFADYFRAFDVFFLDGAGRRLVPVPVHLAVGDRLPTALVTSLARGPVASDGALRTYVPDVAAVSPAVPVGATGVADVELEADDVRRSAADRDRLSAQVVRTLRQVPEVSGVRIVLGGAGLTVAGDPVQPVGSWGTFVPAAGTGRFHVVAEDRLFQVEDGEREPVVGAWGDDARGIVDVAVGDGVAGVLPGRDAVRVTRRDGSKPRTVEAVDVVAVQWADDGRLWVVDRPAGGTRVRLVDDDDVRDVDDGALAALDVTELAVSPDGGRYVVLTTDGAVRVGAVLRDGDDQVTGLRPPARVATSARRPSAVAWLDGSTLSLLADSEAGRQEHDVVIDGSGTTGGASGGRALLPDVGARALVVGGGETPDRYALDDRERLWFLPPGGTWRLVAGGDVTALAVAR